MISVYERRHSVVDMVTRNPVFNSSLEHTRLLGAQCCIVAPIIALFETVYSMACMQAAN